MSVAFSASGARRPALDGVPLGWRAGACSVAHVLLEFSCPHSPRLTPRWPHSSMPRWVVWASETAVSFSRFLDAFPAYTRTSDHRRQHQTDSVFHSAFSFGSAGTGSGESHRLKVTRQVGGLWVLASGCSRVSVPGVAASLPPQRWVSFSASHPTLPCSWHLLPHGPNPSLCLSLVAADHLSPRALGFPSTSFLIRLATWRCCILVIPLCLPPQALPITLKPTPPLGRWGWGESSPVTQSQESRPEGPLLDV